MRGRAGTQFQKFEIVNLTVLFKMITKHIFTKYLKFFKWYRNVF